MSCSDTIKSKRRKTSDSGNMGDVLGKECGDSENDELQQESCEENVREEADGASSVDEQSSPVNGEVDSVDTNPMDEGKVQNTVSQRKPEAAATPLKEEKPCNCDTCKDRRELAAEQMEEMRRLQSFWMELRQYIRMVYRMAMEGSSIEESEEEEVKMIELVQKLCARDPHQLFQRLESQVQEFVIETKVRQLELLHREEQTPEVAEKFLRGLLEGFDKLCDAAKQLTPLLQQLETEHLQRFNLTWEVLNKHLYQSCVYTDPLVQNNLPHYIGKLRNIIPGGDTDVYTELVHKYLIFDDEMTLIGAMWRDAENLIHEYNQEQATLKAKQRMLREDWELFKAQRKLIQQKMWSKTTSELREFDEQLMNLAALAGSPESPREGSPEDAGAMGTVSVSAGAVPACGALGVGTGFCLGRGCSCEECAMSHLLTCGGLVPAQDVIATTFQSTGSYSHKPEVRDFRIEAEGSELPTESPAEPNSPGDDAAGDGDDGDSDPSATPQQSCECHVCTAPLMSPMDLLESFECHACVQQGLPPPGGSTGLNVHGGGFHLYPHIHGTGGGGDASSLYPHLYNIHPSLLSQLGTKHSRLGAHLQDQIQLASIDLKSQHLVPPVPPVSVADLLPPGLTLETVAPASPPATPTLVCAPSSSTAPLPLRPNLVVSPPVPAAAMPVAPVAPTSPLPTGPTPIAAPKAISVHQQRAKANAACQAQAQGPGTVGKMQGAEKLPQSSAATQTSPKVLKVTTANTLVNRQVAQGLVKRVSPGAIGHPVPTRSSAVSSVRHSMTQTANSGSGHNQVNQSLPDVVKSAASSTTPHRPAPGPAGKAIGHSCHKNLKSSNVEPIKRVSCTDSPDGDVVDLEDSSSQDDTCSERSSSTTTSTQRDSRHCDCCYCEVFGHGVPSVAPVSRNYQEMRERLRLLLTKKKAKCKMSSGSTGGSAAGSVPQTATNQSSPTNEVPTTSSKPSASKAPAPSPAPAVPPPQQPVPVPPVLAKQDSADSLTPPSDDPRDLEALLEFIEGNPSGRCNNLKKAAKKARQKQKKLEEKEKKEKEEAERLRGLSALQNNAPEVTITVVNTPGGRPSDDMDHVPPVSTKTLAPAGKSVKGSKHVDPAHPAPAPTASAPVGVASTKPSTTPQMVTIKRVMEPNGAEPTVTITLKGATPDKDKVLFTLVNGQVCQSPEEPKPTSQVPSDNSKNGKKKKNKGNNNNDSSVSNNNLQQQNPVKSKSQQNTAKNSSAKAQGNSGSGNGKVNANKLQQQQQQQLQMQQLQHQQQMQHQQQLQQQLQQQKQQLQQQLQQQQQQQQLQQQLQHLHQQQQLQQQQLQQQQLQQQQQQQQLQQQQQQHQQQQYRHQPRSVSVPVANVPPMPQPNGPATAIHLNGVSTGPKGPTSVAALRSKIDTTVNNSRSFNLENLKLPPGITITKVDGPTAAAAAQRRAQLKTHDAPKPPPAMSTPPSSTTIIAAPTAMGNPTRISGFGPAVNGSNVIVVDTGRMKEDLESNVTSRKDSLEENQNSGGNGKKKKKKNKNGGNENENHISITNGNNKSQLRQPQQQPQGPSGGSQMNGKQTSNPKNQNQPQNNHNSTSVRTQLNHNPQPVRQSGCPPKSANLSQSAIIKVNGSMVTIRNPAMQHAISTASPRMPPHMNGQAEVQMNGDLSGKNTGAKVKKVPVSAPVMNGIITTKGKENSGAMRGRASQPECNGLNGMHMGRTGARTEEAMASGRSSAMNGAVPPRMRPLQQQVNQKMGQNHNHAQDSRRASMQAQAAEQEALAAEAKQKKKKNKKKGPGGPGHADDWTLVESVFTPKDIDLENGDIDDDERELEAFKRFCFNSVPPQRKEKVHLNIKDIVLKKKSAIGCS